LRGLDVFAYRLPRSATVLGMTVIKQAAFAIAFAVAAVAVAEYVAWILNGPPG
jgi:hypothetical protein